MRFLFGGKNKSIKVIHSIFNEYKSSPRIFIRSFHSTNQVQQISKLCYVHRFGDSKINYIDYRGTLYDERYFKWDKDKGCWQPKSEYWKYGKAPSDIQKSFCHICKKPLNTCIHGGGPGTYSPTVPNRTGLWPSITPNSGLDKTINLPLFIILCIFIFIVVIAIILFIYIPLIPYIDGLYLNLPEYYMM